MNQCGKEAGAQNLDWMDKNCVRRRGAPGELARDSEAPKGSKRLYVNAARIRGKLSHLIRGDLRRVSGETEEIERSSDRDVEVSRGRSSRWSNDHPGRAGKPAYRAKGRTIRELSRKEEGKSWAVESWQDQTGRGSIAEGVR